MRSDEPTERWAPPGEPVWSSDHPHRERLIVAPSPAPAPVTERQAVDVSVVTMPTTSHDRFGPRARRGAFHGKPMPLTDRKSFTGNASEQRRSGPTSGPPGIAIGAHRNLPELGNGVALGHPLDRRGEPDLRQAVLRPTVDAVGRLAHEQPAADPEQGSSALRNDRRRAERPGGHDIGGRPVRPDPGRRPRLGRGPPRPGQPAPDAGRRRPDDRPAGAGSPAGPRSTSVPRGHRGGRAVRPRCPGRKRHRGLHPATG